MAARAAVFASTCVPTAETPGQRLVSRRLVVSETSCPSTATLKTPARRLVSWQLVVSKTSCPSTAAPRDAGGGAGGVQDDIDGAWTNMAVRQAAWTSSSSNGEARICTCGSALARLQEHCGSEVESKLEAPATATVGSGVSSPATLDCDRRGSAFGRVVGRLHEQNSHSVATCPLNGALNLVASVVPLDAL